MKRTNTKTLNSTTTFTKLIKHTDSIFMCIDNIQPTVTIDTAEIRREILYNGSTITLFSTNGANRDIIIKEL